MFTPVSVGLFRDMIGTEYTHMLFLRKLQSQPGTSMAGISGISWWQVVDEELGWLLYNRRGLSWLEGSSFAFPPGTFRLLYTRDIWSSTWEYGPVIGDHHHSMVLIIRSIDQPRSLTEPWEYSIFSYPRYWVKPENIDTEVCDLV